MNRTIHGGLWWYAAGEPGECLDGWQAENKRPGPEGPHFVTAAAAVVHRLNNCPRGAIGGLVLVVPLRTPAATLRCLVAAVSERLSTV